jgi:uncharacterized protein (TIGR00290 family)
VEPVVLAWSGGKDCALALHTLNRSPRHRVVGLLTTLTSDYDRISMHGVRRSLLEMQAAAAGLPLMTVEIAAAAPNESYERAMGAALAAIRESGTTTIAFGDLFLRDVREYREAMLAGAGTSAIFPLWGRDTTAVAHEVIELGFQAILTCVDGEVLPGEFAGRDFDTALLAELSRTIDPCGENGEFHTFVHAGPVLSGPVPVRRGEAVTRDERFHFRDLLPA